MRLAEGDLAIFYSPRKGERAAKEYVGRYSYRSEGGYHISQNGEMYEYAELLVPEFVFENKRRKIRGEEDD
jgi:hypothetical protein